MDFSWKHHGSNGSAYTTMEHHTSIKAPWRYHESPMKATVLPWWLVPYNMVLPWFMVRTPMMLPWYSYGDSMCFQGCVCASIAPMRLPCAFLGLVMVLPWFLHGAFTKVSEKTNNVQNHTGIQCVYPPSSGENWLGNSSEGVRFWRIIQYVYTAYGMYMLVKYFGRLRSVGFADSGYGYIWKSYGTYRSFEYGY